EAGGVVRRAGTAAELRDLKPQDVLVLAEAPCLSEGELANVRAHLKRGGGLVANWAVGARDAECAWRGWEAVAELTGAEDVREIPSREALFLTVPAGVSLSPGIDPGTRIELRPDPSLALRVSGAKVYWSDWALNPAPDESGGGADAAALAAHSPHGGRVTWFGFRLSQVATHTDSLRVARLVRNGLWWSAGVPLAAPAPWPEARRAALVFALDVEDESQNALAVADMFRRRQVLGSFYAVSQLVRDDEELATWLEIGGEVGSQTSDHTPVAGLTAQEQMLRLQRSWTEIAEWTGHAPLGLHPPEERFDANTLSAWAAAGGTYLLGSNEARSGSPELHGPPSDRLVLLPRLLRDDYNILVQDRVVRASRLRQAFLEDLRKFRAIGGLAVVATHTQIMRPGPRLDALGAVVDSARTQPGWWIARGGDVADWWSARAEVGLRFAAPESVEHPELAASGVSDLLVTAPSDRGVEGLWIDVVYSGARLDVTPLVDGQPVDFAATEWGLRVPVTDLPAGATRRIAFVIRPENRAAWPTS
ncbi:MAG TPA: polysaccharide deacetylase family protein, partial [Longimicrobiales bacterium]|nr:polysaccharide deacetylase family protein [Longimicrobiales bacterium]